MKKLFMFLLLLCLAGCGGGGGSGGGASTISGVAATGAPLVGSVYLKDSSTPSKELSDAIATDGSFVLNVDGLKAPFILKAQGTSGGTSYTLYSFSSTPGIANINPIANIAVASAAGGADLATLYTTPLATTMQTVALNLAKAVTDIQTKLQPLFVAYNVTANPVSGNYKANHLELDGVLDMVNVTISGTGTVTITNKLTNAVMSTGSVSSITNWSPMQNIPLPPVVVNVTPDTAIVNTSGTATFTASVSNTTNTQILWSVVEAGGGTITSSGVYTAPASIGTATTKAFTVKATSVAEPTKFDTAVITVTTGTVVTLSPTSATVLTSGTKTFTANVTNSANALVNWSVVEVGGGTITQSGFYTAPSSTGTYHVKATSSADSTKYASATVTVTSVGVTISPSSASLATSATKSFTASISNSINTQVTWSVVEAGGGTITSSGVYTAPSTAGTYHVKAVSAADPTKSATTTITVTVAPQPFPIGTWVGPNGVSLTVSRLVSSGSLVKEYAGSVSYAGETITISGDGVTGTGPGQSNEIAFNYLGIFSFQVISGSGSSMIVMSFFSDNPNSTQMTGVLANSGTLNMNAVFTKQ